MKKKFKILSIILVIVMLCPLLTGCAELDDLKEHHAVFTTKGDMNSITYKGTVYKALPPELEPHVNLEIGNNYVNLTEPDVPVLLSTNYDLYSMLMISDNGNFIYGEVPADQEYLKKSGQYAAVYCEDGENVIYEGSQNVTMTYCKEVIYDEVLSELQSGVEYTKYGFEHYTESDTKLFEQSFDDINDIYEYVYLNEEQTKAVDDIIKTVKPEKNSAISTNSTYVTDLDRVSENERFAKVSYNVCFDGTSYYLIEITDYEYYEYTRELDDYNSYKVPSKYHALFAKMFKNETVYTTSMG